MALPMKLKESSNVETSRWQSRPLPNDGTFHWQKLPLSQRLTGSHLIVFHLCLTPLLPQARDLLRP